MFLSRLSTEQNNFREINFADLKYNLKLPSLLAWLINSHSLLTDIHTETDRAFISHLTKND